MILLTGCQSLQTRLDPSPSLLLEKEKIQTFQSQLQILLKTPGSRIPLQGWLYLKKPASFRIELFDRFGTLVWLLRTNGEEYFYYSSQDNTTERGRWSEIEERSGAPVPIFPQELTRILLTEPLPEGSGYFFKQHRKKPEVVVEKRDASRKRIWVVHFLNFAEVEGTILADQMELDFPSEKLSLQISYRNFSPNPLLNADLFEEKDG
ncbi:MAG: hypothetical protein HY538_05815 [Deltaproteobacteria bacterium]|nr:hypothetical protein [Deltaproteobacteria bacterium]